MNNFLCICFLASQFILLSTSVKAQQFVVDDAGVTDHRSFQVEAWYGIYSSWFLPAYGLFPGLEFTPGLGYVRDEDGEYDFAYVLQMKYVHRDVDLHKIGWGFAAGTGFSPVHQTGNRSLDDIFAYGILSLALGDGRIVLHGNAGWIYTYDAPPDEAPNLLTFGIRADAVLHRRVTLIAESFTEGRESPQVHAGLRFSLIRDFLEMDLSYGIHTMSGEHGAGFNAGLALTP
jgi:hypothetical protein